MCSMDRGCRGVFVGEGVGSGVAVAVCVGVGLSVGVGAGLSVAVGGAAGMGVEVGGGVGGSGVAEGGSPVGAGTLAQPPDTMTTTSNTTHRPNGRLILTARLLGHPGTLSLQADGSSLPP